VSKSAKVVLGLGPRVLHVRATYVRVARAHGARKGQMRLGRLGLAPIAGTPALRMPMTLDRVNRGASDGALDRRYGRRT
jgi:hypothetical protein